MRHLGENPGDLPSRSLPATDARTSNPRVPWTGIPRLRAARRAAVSSVSSMVAGPSIAIWSAAVSPACNVRSRARAWSSAGGGFAGRCGAPSRLGPAEGFRTMTLNLAPNCRRHDHLGEIQQQIETVQLIPDE